MTKPNNIPPPAASSKSGDAASLCPHIYGFRDEQPEGWLLHEKHRSMEDIKPDVELIQSVDDDLYGIAFPFCPMCREILNPPPKPKELKLAEGLVRQMIGHHYE